MRMPVKRPGPDAAATASKSVHATFARASKPSTTGRTVSSWGFFPARRAVKTFPRASSAAVTASPVASTARRIIGARSAGPRP